MVWEIVLDGTFGGSGMSLFHLRQKLRQSKTKIVISYFFIAVFFNFGFTSSAFALSSVTLPKGVYSPAFRYGNVGGLEQRYTETGTLVRLNDYKSIEFDAKNLARFNSQAQSLITTLNRFGAFNLGDTLNLGTLEIQTKPEIKYFAPVLAFGVSNNWSIGVGLPVVTYKNEIKLAQSFSNINYYRTQFSGLSQDLDEALNTNIGESTQQTVVAKGYQRIESQDKQFLADAQVVSLYKLYEDDHQTVIHQATLNLPTGPKNNADDLVALNSFHKTTLENTFGYSRNLGSVVKLMPYTAVKIAVPDQVEARVPKNEDDILPDQDTKETVNRAEGMTFEIGIQSALQIFESFQVSFDYKLGAKTEDRYSGSKSSRYDLLTKNSAARWQKISTEFIYSTVKSYLQKKSFMPMTLSLSIFDTVSGVNIERRTGQELSAVFFF